MFSLAHSDLAESPTLAATELARFIWTAVIAVCVLPLVMTVLIGAAARAHSLILYVGATACVAALAPWLVRAAFGSAKASSASPGELHFAFVFFLTGAASGFVFWLLAGRSMSARAGN
jgi:hypothetical protein